MKLVLSGCCGRAAGSGDGRRLTSTGGSSGGSTPTTRRRQQQELLASPLLLSLTDFGVIFGVVTLVHLMLLACWRRCLTSLRESKVLPHPSPPPSPPDEEAAGEQMVTEAEGYQLFLSRKSKSGYMGVSEMSSGGFQARRFTSSQRLVDLGLFDTALDAAVAYAKHAAADGMRAGGADETKATNANGGEKHPAALQRKFSTKRQMRRSASSAKRLGKKVKEMPSGFRPLPAALIWPNMEVMIFVFFTAGIVESAAAILDGAATGVMDDAGYIALAIVCCTIVFLFLVHEGFRIRRFYKLHASELWEPSPVLDHYSEVDDPLLRLFARCRIMRPRLRFRGSYDAPEEDAEEPARSMRSLQVREALSTRSHKDHPGDVFGKLSGYWLADVGGGRRGASYHLSKATTQVFVAFFSGLGATAAAGSSSGLAFAIILSSMQIMLGLFYLIFGPSGDRLEGAATGLEFLLFGIAAAVSYAAGLPENEGNDGLENASTILLFVAPSIAVTLSIYDVLLLPLLGACLEKDGWAGCKASIYAAVLLPLEMIFSQGDGGMSDSAGNILQAGMEIEGNMTETTVAVASGRSEHSLRKEKESEEDAEARKKAIELRKMRRLVEQAEANEVAAFKAGWDPLKPTFYLLRRTTVLVCSTKSLPRMQELRSKRQLEKHKIPFSDAFRGQGILQKTLFVSHTWEATGAPDTEGAQLAAIQSHLKEHQEIEYVWYDYACLPQSDETSDGLDGRSGVEMEECRLMTIAMVDLFLTASKVLILLDDSYGSRFWCQLEAWCAMQTASAKGVRTATDEEKRHTILCIHNAQDVGLEERLATKTPGEMAKLLKKPDAIVTNEKDRATMLPIVSKANEHVKEMVAKATGKAYTPTAEMPRPTLDVNLAKRVLAFDKLQKKEGGMGAVAVVAKAKHTRAVADAAERQKQAEDDFLEADTDGSGTIDEEELLALFQKLMRKRMAGTDAKVLTEYMRRFRKSPDTPLDLEFDEFVKVYNSFLEEWEGGAFHDSPGKEVFSPSNVVTTVDGSPSGSPNGDSPSFKRGRLPLRAPSRQAPTFSPR